MRTLTRPLIGAGVLALLAAAGYAAADRGVPAGAAGTARDHGAGLWAACR